MPLAQTIGLETLSKYFHLPINDVAKELGVCATVLKKICRKNGIPRWPHRKIKSLDKMITTLEVSVAKNPEDGERIRHEIHTLKNKKMFLMKNPNVLATKAPTMKKGKTSQKDSKSPIGSPESPSMRGEHPMHGAPYPFVYPYGNYPDHPQYPPNMYPAYNMYHTTAYKGAPMPYPYYPYPPHYPMEHRRPIEEECLSPSMVLDPVAAALYLQIPHPHMPHPAMMVRAMESPTDKPQWVPTGASAFAPTLRAKISPSPAQPVYLSDMYTEQPHMVPHHSPSHGHHSPPHHSPHVHHSPSVSHHAPSDYLIHLPELRLPDEKEKPKTLSTLEPGLVTPNSPTNANNPSNTTSSPSPSSPSSPSSSSPSPKLPVPGWFEAEQQLMRKDTNKGFSPKRREEELVPGNHTPPPLSVGE